MKRSNFHLSERVKNKLLFRQPLFGIIRPYLVIDILPEKIDIIGPLAYLRLVEAQIADEVMKIHGIKNISLFRNKVEDNKEASK